MCVHSPCRSAPGLGNKNLYEIEHSEHHYSRFSLNEKEQLSRRVALSSRRDLILRARPLAQSSNTQQHRGLSRLRYEVLLFAFYSVDAVKVSACKLARPLPPRHFLQVPRKCQPHTEILDNAHIKTKWHRRCSTSKANHPLALDDTNGNITHLHYRT